MHEDDVIAQVCDLATTGRWTVFDIIDLYKEKMTGNDTWELLKRMMSDGLVRIDSRGKISVYN